MRVLFVVGLPGSGKTTYAAERAEALRAHLFDDPREFTPIQQSLSRGERVVIADPHLVRPQARRAALERLREASVPESEVEWVFFANDPAACLANALRRVSLEPGKRVEREIRLLSPLYEIPPGSQVLPVWRSP